MSKEVAQDQETKWYVWKLFFSQVNFLYYSTDVICLHFKKAIQMYLYLDNHSQVIIQLHFIRVLPSCFLAIIFCVMQVQTSTWSYNKINKENE